MLKISHWICQFLLAVLKILLLCILRQFGVKMFRLSVYLIDELGFISTIFTYFPIFPAFSFCLRYFHLLFYFFPPRIMYSFIFHLKKYNKHSSVWTSIFKCVLHFPKLEWIFFRDSIIKKNQCCIIVGVPLPPLFAFHPPPPYLLIWKLYALYLFFPWLPIYFNR